MDKRLSPTARGIVTIHGDRRGFILPLSVLLVLLLTVSGTSFMHQDFLERVMTMNETDHKGSFYLANAAIERTREVLTFDIDPGTGVPNWGPVLNGADPYTVEGPPYAWPQLCSSDPGKNCVIMPFGDSVSQPDLPFAGTFDDGFYVARVFNDSAEPDDTDVNGLLTIRALGDVRGQQKILEVTVAAASGLNLINCQNADASAKCPDKQNPNADIDWMEGRDPASSPVLPVWQESFYRDYTNLPCSAEVPLTGDITFVSGATSTPGEQQIESGKCYYVTGNATLQSVGTGYQDVVIFSDGSLLANGQAELADSLLISLGNAQLQGNMTLHAQLPYPALIVGGDLTKGDASVEIKGTVYVEGALGSNSHPINPDQIEGVIIGQDVYLKAAATGVTDANNPAYYGFMPGFIYPKELMTTSIDPGSWKELQ